jgi:hypothetical protein
MSTHLCRRTLRTQYYEELPEHNVTLDIKNCAVLHGIGFDSARYSCTTSKQPRHSSKKAMQEHFEHGELPISSGVMVGLISSGSGAVDPNDLHVMLPMASAKWLCLVVISQDGKYWAAMQYLLSAGVQGDFVLEYPTKYASALKSYDKGTVAVLAELKEDCSKPTKLGYAVVAWGKSKPESGVTLQVNTSDAKTSILYSTLTNNGPLEIDCNGPNKEPHIAFDNECTLPSIKTIVPGSIKIKRRIFKNILPSVNVGILTP